MTKNYGNTQDFTEKWKLIVLDRKKIWELTPTKIAEKSSELETLEQASA